MIAQDEFFIKPQLGEMSILMVGEGPNLISSFVYSAGGLKTYFNNWMNFTHIEYWGSAEGDTGIKGEKVSDYMTEIWRRIKFTNGSEFLELGGPFNGYRIETWKFERAQQTPDAIDGGIDKYAGLTWPPPLKLTRINSKYCRNGSTYSHEFGHNYQFCCDMTEYSKTKVGAILNNEYTRIRGIDFTNRTPRIERFAEDFKYFFGTNDVALIDNPNDDAANPTQPNVGKKIRWPREVPGLRCFIQGAWPVFNWLNDKEIIQFNFLDDSSWFKWERKTSWFTSQWEAFADGIFYRWDGSNWVIYK